MSSRHLICLLLLAQRQTSDSGLLLMVLIIIFGNLLRFGYLDIQLWGGNSTIPSVYVDQSTTSVNQLKRLLWKPFLRQLISYFGAINS